MLVKISKGYQLTIPAFMRNRFGIKPETEVDVKIEGAKIVITPLDNFSMNDVFRRADRFKPHNLSPKRLQKFEDGLY